MKKFLLIVLILLLPFNTAKAQETSQFNLEHVRGAINYFEANSEALIGGGRPH